MPGEKRFRTSFMGGFKKADVNAYIEKILGEFDDKLKGKDDEIDSLKNQNREFKSKYEDLIRKADQIKTDREELADAIVDARRTAKQIIEDARQEAVEEKKKLEEIIEQEKEKLVDIRQEMKTLKAGIVSTLQKYGEQLGAVIHEEEDQAG